VLASALSWLALTHAAHKPADDSTAHLDYMYSSRPVASLPNLKRRPEPCIRAAYTCFQAHRINELGIHQRHAMQTATEWRTHDDTYLIEVLVHGHGEVLLPPTYAPCLCR
jgi:hypothetical protein